MSKLKEMSGQKFGRLLILSFSHLNTSGDAYWNVRCDCGIEKKIKGSSLRSGVTISCGCYRAEKASSFHLKHGLTKSKAYNSWDSMKSRVLNKNHKRYHEWGGRGITICDSWLSFEGFYKDMGDPPSEKHSLGRIDNEKGYCLENCRWELPFEQMNNTSVTRYLTLNGVTKPMSIWCKEYNMSKSTVRSRLKAGWTVERALTVVAKKRRQSKASFT